MTSTATIAAAVAALPQGALDEAALARHIAPLFSRHRAATEGRVYLANHSLGRPLDATADDLEEGMAAWYAAMGDAWDAWQQAQDEHRARVARLLHAPRADCVIPKTSAGQGLRAVLNSLDGTPRVVATTGEFDSIDTILRAYAHRRRISVDWVAPREQDQFAADDIVAAIARGCELVVVSDVMFMTGQRLPGLAAIVAAAHAQRARVLLDVYHSLGVLDVDVAATAVDYAVGGSYKYLRGGPGACFLYVSPAELDRNPGTLDIGWFARAAPMQFERVDPPRWADGGDAWLESTPAVLTYYQARAGATLLGALGVARIRAHSQQRQRRLVEQLRAHGVAAVGGGDMHGAFVVIDDPAATEMAGRLRRAGIDVDARSHYLRMCPDILTTAEDLERAVAAVAGLRPR